MPYPIFLFRPCVDISNHRLLDIGTYVGHEGPQEALSTTIDWIFSIGTTLTRFCTIAVLGWRGVHVQICGDEDDYSTWHYESGEIGLEQ